MRDLGIGNQLEHVADKFQFNCSKSNELLSIKFSFLWGIVSNSQFIKNITKSFPIHSWQWALQFLNVKLSQKIVQYKYEEKRQKFQKAKKAKYGVQLILFGYCGK